MTKLNRDESVPAAPGLDGQAVADALIGAFALSLRSSVIGSPMDSTGFACLAQVVAGRHTVVTYDLRGIGHSAPW